MFRVEERKSPAPRKTGQSKRKDKENWIWRRKAIQQNCELRRNEWKTKWTEVRKVGGAVTWRL